MIPVSDELLKQGIDRIARTPDGRLLDLYCRRRMMEVCLSSEAGTLQRSEGERTFASHLRSLMLKGLEESGGRSTSSIDDQPVIFAGPKPVESGRPRGAGRRINENTRVPGYDLPDEPA